MKNAFKLSLLAILISSVSLMSCKKDKKDDSPAPSPCSFCLTLDGTSKSASSTSAYNLLGELQITGTLAINTSTFSTETVTLTLDTLGKGTFTIGGGTSRASAIYHSMDGDSYYTSSTNTGTLVITSYDATSKKVSGTFSFKAADSNNKTVNVTSGQFNDLTIH